MIAVIVGVAAAAPAKVRLSTIGAQECEVAVNWTRPMPPAAWYPKNTGDGPGTEIGELV
ncbi:MAG: hypothetical protein IPF66_09975 [Holophagales bacterium]|nr:hypothetical protein [Holophagales bacterium]